MNEVQVNKDQAIGYLPRMAACYFCEDIRFEMRGMVSLIGLISGRLVVNREPPLVLPKLGLFIEVRTSLEEAPQRLTFVVSSPWGRELLHVESSGETLAAEVARARADPTSEGFTLGLRTVLSPLPVDALGRLRVTVGIDGVPFNAGSLLIERG